MRTILFAGLLASLGAAALVSGCSGDIGDLEFGGGGAGGNNNTGNGGSGEGGAVSNPQFAPAPGGMRRLLARQYVNSVKVLFGPSASAVAVPPTDASLHEFDAIGNAELSLAPTAVEQYETSARAIAEVVAGDDGILVPYLTCVPMGPADTECHRQFAEALGRVAWRRALTDAETTALANLGTTAATDYNNFYTGTAHIVSAILQSPDFIYMVEVGAPDTEHPEWRRLSAAEVATRMSFFLLDATPDRALLDEAESGGLDTTEQIRAKALQILATPEAHAANAAFYDELFKLDDIAEAGKDQTVFPQFNDAVAQSMRAETQAFLQDLIWNQNGDYRTLYTADYTFVDANLAPLYGVATPPGGMGKVTLPAEQGRSGFLGHASYLTRFSHPADTSPTRRGVFISNTLFCIEIPAPPAGVNTTLPEFDPNEPMTKKQVLTELHSADTMCHSCHSQMDPYGFSMEIYDAIGRHRTTDEHGLTIDPSGEVAGVGSFENAAALGQLLHDDSRATACIVKNLFRHSMGHLEKKGELPAINQIADSFESSGYKLQQVLVDIVTSPAFVYVDDPK